MTDKAQPETTVTAPDLMTADEAARHLHMSSEDVRDLVARGDLAGRQTRDGMRLNRPDVEAYAARSGGAPGTEQHTS